MTAIFGGEALLGWESQLLSYSLTVTCTTTTKLGGDCRNWEVALIIPVPVRRQIKKNEMEKKNCCILLY